MGVNHLGVGGLEQQVQQLWHAVRAVSKATLQNGAIGRAGLRVYEAGRILFQGGGGVEIQGGGYIKIDGDLTGAGDFDWAGAFTQTGPSVFTGTINATGNTAWSGMMTIVGPMRVQGGGDIKIQGANAITLGQDGGGRASINFSTGYIVGDANGITIYPNSGPKLYINENGIRIAAMPTKTSTETGLPAGVVHADASGYLYRIV